MMSGDMSFRLTENCALSVVGENFREHVILLPFFPFFSFLFLFFFIMFSPCIGSTPAPLLELRECQLLFTRARLRQYARACVCTIYMRLLYMFSSPPFCQRDPVPILISVRFCEERLLALAFGSVRDFAGSREDP